jgi:hypothetical protein
MTREGGTVRTSQMAVLEKPPSRILRPPTRPGGYGRITAPHHNQAAFDRQVAAYERLDAQYAAPTFVDPGPTNTDMPSWEATGTIVAFIRDPSKFPMRRYVYWRPSDRLIGLYKVMDFNQAARIVTDAEYDWPDGMERPEGQDNLMGWYDVPFKMNRKWYGWTLGNLTIENCPWQIEAAQGAQTMQQAMTNRCNRFCGMMENPTNWGANTADANVLNNGAGYWDTADTVNYAIRKTINAVVVAIKRATNGMVGAKDLRCVIGAGAAPAIGQSKEMADYVKQAYSDSKAAIQGDIYGSLQEFNIPPKLYGVETVIEDSTIVTSQKGASTVTQGFIKDGNSVVITAMVQGMPGDQVGSFAVPNFSTMQWMGYGGELQSQVFQDARNERVTGGCKEIFIETMPAPVSGYLITNVLSTGPIH